MVELNITIKGEESTYKQKFLVYEDFQLRDDDPIVKAYVEEALGNAKIIPEWIKVRALLIVL